MTGKILNEETYISKEIAPKNKCTGCGACASVCMKNALVMDADIEGFYYPKVDYLTCNNCNACIRVCPVISKQLPNDSTCLINAEVAHVNSLSDRLAGSSGGIFGLLADWVLDKNGVVYGAAFTNDCKTVVQCSTDTNSLSDLKKSKYLESYNGNIFRKVKLDLDQGRYVLFCGTPCQIAGLSAYLGRSYSNLVKMDFLCHGVPSQKVFQSYILELEKQYQSSVTSVEFRSKYFGWKSYCIRVSFSNNAIYLKTKYEDSYLIYFFESICLRQSCYECNRAEYSSSDITVGDYWNIRDSKILDDDIGDSIIIPRTYIGESIVSYMKTSKAVSLYSVQNYKCPNQAYSEEDREALLLRRKVFMDSFLSSGYCVSRREFKSKIRAILYRLRAEVRRVRFLLKTKNSNTN